MSKFVKDMLKARYDRHQVPPMYLEDRERNDYARDYYGSDYTRYDYRRSDYTHREPYPDMRSRDYEHYQQYPNHNDYAMSGRRDRGDYGIDYGEMEYGKMSDKDIEKWSSALVNADGTKGKHFKKEQVEHLAKQIGFDVHRVGGMQVFCMATNMMYADYCAAARKFGADVPEFYAEMAKAFLEDKDFGGTPEEKLWLYYKCIAEQED